MNVTARLAAATALLALLVALVALPEVCQCQLLRTLSLTSTHEIHPAPAIGGCCQAGHGLCED